MNLEIERFEGELRQLRQAHVDPVNITQEHVDEMAKDRHEPVAWISQKDVEFMRSWLADRNPSDARGYIYGGVSDWRTNLGVERSDDKIVPLYVAPPKREWVRLTEQQYAKIETRVWNEHMIVGGWGTGAYAKALWQAIETALEEKNT